MPILPAFSPSSTLASRREPGPRPRAPLPAGGALLRASAKLADFCNRNSTRGHTRRAFDPRTRVGLSPRYSPAPTDAGCVGLVVRCRTGDLRATIRTRRLFARRVPLAWTGRTVGRGTRAKASARSWTIRACPPRSASGTRVTGSTRSEVWSPSQLVAPAEIPLGCRPAKGDTGEGIEVPFAATKSLRERGIAPPCAPGSEPCHATSEEVLLGDSRALFRGL